MAEYYFIVNPKSRTGKTRQIWEELVLELERRKVDYQAFCTEYKGHAKELAKKITTENEKGCKLVVVGGDGTSNEVLNGITDFKNVQVGFIPTGSGNDLGRGLELAGTPVELLNRILDATEVKKFDLGEVSWKAGQEKRRFAISSGIGLDADVCKQALTSKLKKFLNVLHLGKLTYVLLTVKTLFAMKTTTIEVETDEGEHFQTDRMICTVAMNLKYEGGGVPMVPGANAEDGKLSFCCICGIPKWKTFFLLPLLVLGKHENIKGFRILQGTELHLRIQRKMVVHADGEYCGDRDELWFRCLEGVLQVRM